MTMLSESPAAFRRASGWVRWAYAQIAFERRMGVRTAGLISGRELGYADDWLQPYEPSDWRILSRVLPKRSVGSGDVFVDFGSGMGRMVLMAAAYPFRRVIGVEMSPAMHERAVENVRRGRYPRRCGEIDLVCADVLEYEIPDDATVFFLYNPFRGEVFSAAIERIVASHDCAPREVRILYVNPLEDELLIASGRVRVTGEWRHSAWRGWPRTVAVRGYRVTPAPPSPAAR
jgi:hypothetical protein